VLKNKVFKNFDKEVPMYRTSIVVLGFLLLFGSVGGCASSLQASHDRQLRQLEADPVALAISSHPELVNPERNGGYATLAGYTASKQRDVSATEVYQTDPASPDYNRLHRAAEAAALAAREAEINSLEEVQARLTAVIARTAATRADIQSREGGASRVEMRIEQLKGELEYVERRLEMAREMPTSGPQLIATKYSPQLSFADLKGTNIRDLPVSDEE